jgi:chromosome segregation ATPase
VVDAERRVGLSEQEAKKSRKGVELLALEVEETQGRLDSLNEELKLAERNISILIEDKKKVEAAKAETAFRLEHATANINSLLFELTQSKESVGKLERENSSLVAQLEELAHKQSKSLEQLKDLPHLYNKVHSLKDCQDSLLKLFASECLKLAEDMKGSDALAVRLSKQFSSLEGENTNVTFNACQDFVKNSYPTIWESEVTFSSSLRRINILCYSVHQFHIFLNDFTSLFLPCAGFT